MPTITFHHACTGESEVLVTFDMIDLRKTREERVGMIVRTSEHGSHIPKEDQEAIGDL